ncbi:MAG: hypothetical protein ACLP7Q_23665 [Isosphaeraceae bacterium]
MTPPPRRQPASGDPVPLKLADMPPGAGHVIEPMLSLDDLAALLKCSRRWLERERTAGRVPRPDFMAGRCPRWKPETIRRWIGEGGRQ